MRKAGEEGREIITIIERNRQGKRRLPAQPEFGAKLTAEANKSFNCGFDTSSRVVLISEALDHDTSSEVIKKKDYAVFALTKSNCKDTIELVQTGPLAVGDLFEDYRILHMNFTVKKADGVVLTYFCELKHTITNDHLHLCQIFNLGPTLLLPEKADTHGCLYCSSHNIHHPDEQDGFQNGGILYLISMCSKLRAIEKYLSLRKHKTKADFNKMFPEPGFEYLTKFSDFTIDRFASVALQIFNSKEGANFELVKVGRHGRGSTMLGTVHHLNFEAKNKGNGDEAVHTFFAQALLRYEFFLVDYCICLGPSSLLPFEADLRGCLYCHSNDGVHHPPNSGYLIGRECDSYNPPKGLV